MHASTEFRRDERFVSLIPSASPARPVLMALALLMILVAGVVAAAQMGVLPPQDSPALDTSMTMVGP